MTRRRAVRWLLCSGLAAVGVIVAIVISIPYWIAPLIERYASASLARPVTIREVALHWGDPTTLIADDVVIGNPPGFARDEEPLVRMARLAVGIDLAASLRRHSIVIASVEIEQPTIRAIETEDGQENYRLPSTSRPQIGGISVLNGRAHISLASLHTDLELTFATERGPGEAGSTRIVAEARGKFAGQPVEAQFASGLPSFAQDTSEILPIEMAVQSESTQASVKGTVQDPFGPGRAKGDFLIAGPNMAVLTPLTGASLPLTSPYKLTGKLDFASEVYRITGAKAQLGRSEAEGGLTVTMRPRQRPEITAEVLSHNIDLRDLGSPLGSKSGAAGTPGQPPPQKAQVARPEGKSSASPRLLPHETLHVAKLDWADVHLTARVQRIQGGSMPLDDLAVGIDIVDGAMTLHQLSIGIGQGRISGDIRLMPKADETLQTRADLQFERVDVSRLMRASGSSQGSGALNGAVHLAGTGRSIAEILAGADGAASFWMLGGELSSLLVDLAGLRLGSALLSALEGSPTTHVECFLADLTVRRGILSTRTLLLDTADAVTEGTGTVDLGQERIQIRLRTQSKHLTVGVLPAPLLITGTLQEPRAEPDPNTPAGRGGIAGALAALPTIQLGIGNAPHCENLLSQARKG
jgi:AsmA family protein